MKFIIKLLIVILLLGTIWKVLELDKYVNSDAISLPFNSMSKEEKEINEIAKKEKELKESLTTIQEQWEKGEIDEEAAKKEIAVVASKLKTLVENNEHIPKDKIIEKSKQLDEKLRITENKDSILNAFDILQNYSTVPQAD